MRRIIFDSRKQRNANRLSARRAQRLPNISLNCRCKIAPTLSQYAGKVHTYNEVYVYLSVKSYAYTTVGVTSHRLFFPLSKGHFSLARLLYLTFITMVTVAYILVAIYISGQNTSQLRHTDLLQKRRRNKGMQT